MPGSANFGSYDPAPLMRYLERQVGIRPGKFTDHHRTTECFGRARSVDADIALEAGVSQRQVQRWRRGALLRAYDADRIACRLGLHPCLLWSDWYGEV